MRKLKPKGNIIELHKKHISEDDKFDMLLIIDISSSITKFISLTTTFEYARINGLISMRTFLHDTLLPKLFELKTGIRPGTTEAAKYADNELESFNTKHYLNMVHKTLNDLVRTDYYIQADINNENIDIQVMFNGDVSIEDRDLYAQYDITRRLGMLVECLIYRTRMNLIRGLMNTDKEKLIEHTDKFNDYIAFLCSGVNKGKYTFK